MFFGQGCYYDKEGIRNNVTGRGDGIMGKQNILDMQNGFNTRVNLYIIKYLYYNMKKADKFMEDRGGRRKASVELNIILEISLQRLNNIFNGCRYSMDEKTSVRIAKLFNISTDYFKKNSEIIQIYGITKDDWICYFYQRNNQSVVKGQISNLKERAGKVKQFLKDITKAEYIASNYDTGSPLYRVYYYFATGKEYKEVGRLDKFLDAIEILKIDDWKELKGDTEKMRKYLYLMKKHYEYVYAYLKCRELEEENE